MQSIGPGAVETVAVLVLDRHQIELTFAEVLGAEVRVAVRQSTCVRRIRIAISEVGLHARHQLFRPRKRPASGCVERWLEDLLVPRVQIAVGVGAAAVRIAFALSSGLNGLPFSMPIDLSRSIIALSRSSQGSIWIMRSSDWKKRRS